MKVFEVTSDNTLSLALFTDVTNSKVLLGDVLAGKLEPEVALLNASLLPDVFPVLAAAHKALISKSRESLTTRTLHSELIYNYSGSKHGTLRDLYKAAALQPQAVHTSSLRRNECKEPYGACDPSRDNIVFYVKRSGLVTHKGNHNFESEQDP